jgi:hypothetical protein
MAVEKSEYKVFGKTLHRNTYKAGDTYQFDPSTMEGICTTFVTAGRSTPVNNSTGEPHTEDHVEGRFLRQFEYPDATFTGHVKEDFEVFCYAPIANRNKLMAPFDPIYLNINETGIFPLGTKLFLCRGTLIINGTEFTGPTSISVTTGNKTVTAQTKCYGLLYNETL